MLTFGVTVDDTNKPIVRPADIPDFCYKKATQINSGVIDFVVREEDEVLDWYHTHSDEEPLFHNTELLEEALRAHGVQRTVEKTFFQVYARAGHLANVILPYFGNYKSGNFDFTWSHGTLRTVNPVYKNRSSVTTAKDEAQRTKIGHLVENFLTQENPEGEGPLVVGKEKNYMIKNLDFGPIQVTVSKEVDCFIDGKMAEIKTTRRETIHPYKYLEIIVKNIVLGEIHELICAHAPSSQLQLVKIACLNGEYVDRVVEVSNHLLRLILEKLRYFLNDQAMDEATGRVETKHSYGRFYITLFADHNGIDRSRCFPYSEHAESLRTLGEYEPEWIVPMMDSSGTVFPASPCL